MTNTTSNLGHEYHKILIDQAPLAIAMLDSNLCYLAFSRKWINDYSLEGQTILGRSHFDLFPEITNESKKKYHDCLTGAIDICNEAPLIRLNGSVLWISWDIRPWYSSTGEIGGVMIYTQDRTKKKNNEKLTLRTKSILEKTSTIAHIGVWELNIEKDHYILSDIARKIFDIPEDYKMNRKRNKSFYKEGTNRDLIIKSMNDCVEKGIPFDLEFQIITEKGEHRWIREIAHSQCKNGHYKRVFGIVHDITLRKEYEKNLFSINQKLEEVNKELNSLLNAGPVIISIDKNGYIKHFNKGAEQLLGYSKEELIGIKKSETFLLKEESDQFHEDLSKKFNVDPNQINTEFLLAEKDHTDSREWNYIKKDGSTVPVYVTLIGVKNDQNESLGLVAVGIDISERIKVEDDLLRKNKLLLHAEKINKMGHWHWDLVTNTGKWSDTMYTLFEISDKNMHISKDTYFDFLHPEDREEHIKLFKKSLKNKEFYSSYIRILTENNTIKIIHVIGEIVLDSKGEIEYMVGTCQDVTEQKMAENKFRGLLDSAPDAMIIIDKNKNIQLINNQAENLFGYTINELIDTTIHKLIPINWNTNHESDLNGNFLNNGAKSNFRKVIEIFGKHKNGTKIPIEISLSPLVTQEEHLVSLAMRDITKQNEARDKIIEANENLEVLTKKLTSKNIQLADFAQIASHNLRSPVSNLNSLLEVYKLADNDEDRIFLFEKFEQVIQHLTSNLDVLVDALKIKGNSKSITKDIFFKDVLIKTEILLACKLIESNATIEVDFSEAESIDYNTEYLESIFLNLIDNSIKYRSDQRSLKISIKSLKTKDNKIKIHFKDNGLGINMERHGSKLFGFNKTFHRNPQAKGIGLFMTKTQIESLGGSITAESNVNKGSIFTVIF